MDTLKIATAQFEHKSNDKKYNLSIIQKLAAEAAAKGADVISFHECSITGYSFARHLSEDQLIQIAEPIPEGESIQALRTIAKKEQIILLAGLFEKDGNDNLFKAYVCVDQHGLRAKYRKLHPFIHPSIKKGNQYIVFDILGWKCGILICYDNNIIENVRATALLGAEIIFMPHVTMGTPSPAPGRGFIDPLLWQNKEKDPTSLRLEFEGPKGRSWLMKWLPSRACDNGVYIIFSNPIGMDDDQVKNGCSMVLDPFGDIIAECHSFEDSFSIGICTREKLEKSGGYRYRMARRPELYRDIIGAGHDPVQQVAWLKK
jgi:predicted amidohydrolase